MVNLRNLEHKGAAMEQLSYYYQYIFSAHSVPKIVLVYPSTEILAKYADFSIQRGPIEHVLEVQWCFSVPYGNQGVRMLQMHCHINHCETKYKTKYHQRWAKYTRRKGIEHWNRPSSRRHGSSLENQRSTVQSFHHQIRGTLKVALQYKVQNGLLNKNKNLLIITMLWTSTWLSQITKNLLNDIYCKAVSQSNA